MAARKGEIVGYEQARAMLHAFDSVGATHFDLTLKPRGEAKEFFRRGVEGGDLSRDIPSILGKATLNQRDVIVRPRGPEVWFVQLDDLAEPQLALLAPALFLKLETSPANFQGWVALSGPENKDFARRLRQGTGADATASGATRVAGSLNFKEKYAPDFPRVAVAEARLGHKTTVATLDQLGVIAPSGFARAASAATFRESTAWTFDGRPRAWPDYGLCVDRAPLNSDKSGPNLGRADFVWCLTAISWGWSDMSTAARLMEVSRNAQKAGERYALRTVASASAAAARRTTQRPHPKNLTAG